MAERFSFGGKENNPELGLEWFDFDARNYDTALGRWMNIDPLASQFYDWSPYNFNYNNPLRFVDPTGLGPEDIIIKGDQDFIDQAFSHLQQLTDETLQIDKNGKVTIASSEQCNDACGVGRDAVSQLINSDKTTTIEESTANNRGGRKNGVVVANDTAENQANTQNGVGTDVILFYRPDLQEGPVDVDGSKVRPPEVALGHELGHAVDLTTGTEPPAGYTGHYVKSFEDLSEEARFDGYNNTTGKNAPIYLYTREIPVIKNFENPIRDQLGVARRKLVKTEDFRYERKY